MSLRQYQPNQKARGKVTAIDKKGAFIQLEPDVVGFLPANELSWTRQINLPSEVLEVGMEIEVMITTPNTADQKPSLSHRQLEPNPGAWSFSIRESKAGELYEDERRKPHDPWGNLWQRQPNLYPWEEIKSSDSLEEAIAKAKIIYRDSVMPLENCEFKNILLNTHPNYNEQY